MEISILTMLLLLKHSLPLFGQLAHSVEHRKMLRGPFAVNSERLRCPPANRR